MRPLLAAALIAALPAHAETPDPEVTSAVLSDMSAAISEGYADFSTAAQTLEDRVGILCEDPSEDALSNARDAFRGAVEAWSRIEMVKFGPVLADNTAERIFFYPDRRGIGLRQVQSALVSEDASVTDPESLAQKSVALQGLGTEEFLLHGTGAETLAGGNDAFRCRFASAVASRIFASAEALSDAWSDPEGIAARLADPSEGNPDFRTQDDALRTILGLFSDGIEITRDQRMAPFIEAVDPADPRGAAWARSGLTADAIASNVEGLRALFENSGLSRLNADTQGSLWSEVDFEMGNLVGILARAHDPEASPEALQGDVRAAAYTAGSLRDTFLSRVAPALGQTAAFSVLDGD